ncbi:MAG: hypothetical protein ABID38_03935 [Candidatus Diapherotrites archaeon]
MKLGMFLLLLVLIFLSIHFDVMWLGFFLAFVLIIYLLGLAGYKTKNAAVSVGKVVGEDINREVEDLRNAKGKYPAFKEIKGLYKEGSKRLAMELDTKEKGKKKFVDKEVLDALGKGSKKFIAAMKKIFD